jgi:hypothetical protein
MMICDLYPNFPIVLNNVGSYYCEDFFPLLGQHETQTQFLYWGGNQVNFAHSMDQTNHT